MAQAAVSEGLGKAAVAIAVSAATVAATQAITAPSSVAPSSVKANPATSNLPGCITGQYCPVQSYTFTGAGQAIHNSWVVMP